MKYHSMRALELLRVGFKKGFLVWATNKSR